MAQGLREKEEEGGVVVAEAGEGSPSAPWHVTLRPWLFCLLFLLLAEGGARLYFDTGLRLQKERLDNFPAPAVLNAYVRQIARDPGFSVVMIGDSTLVGGAKLRKRENVPRLLEEELRRRLPDRNVHVWNLSMAGARATDMHLVLLAALEAKPDLVVVQGNYYITGMHLEKQPVFHPWLAHCVRLVPESIRPLLEKRDAKGEWEERLVNAVEGGSRLVGMRQAINARLFGAQSKVAPFEAPNPLVMAAMETGRRANVFKPETWKDRGFDPTSFGYYYSRDFDPETNLNLVHYADLVRDLEKSGVPALTYLTPQNPAILEACLSEGRYKMNRDVLRGALSRPTIPCLDYSDLVPDGQFTDNDHMLTEGNRLVAVALADALAPRIAGATLSSRREATAWRTP